MKILILLIIPIATIAQDKPVPIISFEIQATFERARANEMETAKLHDADVAILRSVFAEAVKICGDGYDVQKPQREGPLVCVAKPQPKQESK